MEEVKRGFQKKTIEKNIHYKMLQWVKTIKPEEADEGVKGDFEKLDKLDDATMGIVAEEKSQSEETNENGLTVFQQKVFDSIVVTGGSIASMLDGDLPNDYDVYFSDIDVALEVGEYYLKSLLKGDYDNVRVGEPLTRKRQDEEGVEVYIKSAGVATDETDLEDYLYFEMAPEVALKKYMRKFDSTSEADNTGKYRAVFISSNAITLTDGVQIILRFCGDAENIHKNFDYVHTMNYWTESGGVVLNLDSLEAIMSKTLKYVGSRYPICSLFRMRKFIKRGWSISAGEVLKMAWDVNELDLRHIPTLRDQLVGVDSAYFTEVIHCLEEGKKAGKDIDRTYLFEIVNRVFEE